MAAAVGALAGAPVAALIVTNIIRNRRSYKRRWNKTLAPTKDNQ